jgi:hypothetical protein
MKRRQADALAAVPYLTILSLLLLLLLLLLSQCH